ncbi:polysaccharide deacetylase family protein [Rhizobium alvei]|uniref:Chitooligosaccharide deacetylase n=1 Tax=Rhizobium alvei TaxID=1132659 RepID=A0ABT8YIK7_9HYPH|nr:polysaccharide deacetylase family protein [Rhizobium alvei]MDO6963461.1 polysaccharide deacetylase family protein [Rhizobium alvei]
MMILSVKPRPRAIPALLALVLGTATPALAEKDLIELHMTAQKSLSGSAPSVFLTFDACMGKTDDRIVDTLINNRIAATFFVTARWINKNPVALARLKAHPDLFEIENHGANHIPAVDRPGSIFGIAAAGSPASVELEVSGGEQAILAAGFQRPRWFRGATAEYTASSMAEIKAMGYQIAGFSLNGDMGATLKASTVERRISAAKDGDVIIAHVNQPDRSSGEGVAKALLALKARGVVFLKLDRFSVAGHVN